MKIDHWYRTYIFFETSKYWLVLELATFIENQLFLAGFTKEDGNTASSCFVGYSGSLSGKKFMDIIPVDSTLLLSASSTFISKELGVGLRATIGGKDEDVFGHETPWNQFMIRVGVKMHPLLLEEEIESVSEEERAKILKAPRLIYQLCRNLFESMDCNRCHGAHDSGNSDEWFVSQPQIFYFSRTEPSVIIPFLE